MRRRRLHHTRVFSNENKLCIPQFRSRHIQLITDFVLTLFWQGVSNEISSQVLRSFCCTSQFCRQVVTDSLYKLFSLFSGKVYQMKFHLNVFNVKRRFCCTSQFCRKLLPIHFYRLSSSKLYQMQFHLKVSIKKVFALTQNSVLPLICTRC
jgi:hypothetical protein